MVFFRKSTTCARRRALAPAAPCCQGTRRGLERFAAEDLTEAALQTPLLLLARESLRQTEQSEKELRAKAGLRAKRRERTNRGQAAGIARRHLPELTPWRLHGPLCGGVETRSFSGAFSPDTAPVFPQPPQSRRFQLTLGFGFSHQREFPPTQWPLPSKAGKFQPGPGGFWEVTQGGTHRQAPVDAQMNRHQQKVHGENIHFFSPPLDGLVARCFQLGEEEGVEGVDSRQTLLFAPLHQQVHVEINDLGEERQRGRVKGRRRFGFDREETGSAAAGPQNPEPSGIYTALKPLKIHADLKMRLLRF